MQCASVVQTYCFCPACDRESASCLNYRAALWILSTTHMLSRYCSGKQTRTHKCEQQQQVDQQTTFSQ